MLEEKRAVEKEVSRRSSAVLVHNVDCARRHVQTLFRRREIMWETGLKWIKLKIEHTFQPIMKREENKWREHWEDQSAVKKRWDVS